MNWRGSSLVVAVTFSVLLRTSAATLPTPATGANVDESRVTKTLRVDPAHTEAADDDKHGTADAPFATLGFACQAAAKAKDAGVGVKIVLASGTYREAAEIRPPANGAADTDAPLVIEAAEREQAVIDGADTEGWSPSTWRAGDGRWTHPWPFRRSAATAHLAGLPPAATGESYRRGDLILVNGAPLRQVNALADLVPGSFWGMLPAASVVTGRHRGAAGESNSGGAGPVAVVQPPADTELEGAIIQVGVRARGLTITGRRNVVVRGLLIQHAAEPGGAGDRTAGLVLDGCSNVLVEDVLSQWNDGVGLVILGRAGGGPASADFTLRRARLLHNGGSGLTVADIKNLLAEDCEASFNNFRGEWAGWIDPMGAAGVKIGGGQGLSGATWRRLHVIGNTCRGLWVTENGADLALEDSAVRENCISGVAIENSRGPALVKRCIVAGTKNDFGTGNSAAFFAGLTVKGTPNVTLESNILAGNEATQLSLGYGADKAGARAERHAYRHNVFYTADPDATLLRMPEHDPALAAYYATMDSQENCFWNAGKEEVFEEYVTAPEAGNRRAAATYKAHALKLADWRADAQRQSGDKGGRLIEANSLWQDPRFVEPGEGDYRLRENSPVADWGLPGEEGSPGQEGQ